MAIFNTVYGGTGWGGGWTPWENTVAYYPLISDFNDASWKWYNLTNNWGTITTLNGVSCAYYNGSGYSYNSSAPVTNIRTLSCWRNPNATGSAMWILSTWIVWSYWESSYKIYWIQQRSNWVICGTDWYAEEVDSTFSVTTGNWYHLVITVENGTTAKLYVNWELKNTITRNNAIQPWQWITISCKPLNTTYPNKMTWYISEAIIENKARTAQEVADYYNKTKSNYWL